MDFDIQLIIKRLKEEAEKNDTSLNQFLINNNLPRYLIDNMKKGRVPSIETIYNFAEKANCSVDYLLGRTDIKEFVKTPTSVTQIPVFKQKAAAGFGKESIDDNSDPPEPKWFYEDQIPAGTKYGVVIEGDSMENKFHDGQTVFVRLSDDCPDGSYGIFTITDNEGTKVFFKQKQMQPDGSYVLHSLNKKEYKDISDFKNKIVRCVAVVVM